MVSRNMVTFGEPDVSCFYRIMVGVMLLFKSLYLELVSYVLVLCILIPLWVCTLLG